jgi:hypothetical protein
MLTYPRQPGTAIDLEHWPVEALSPVDCFHPSEAAHQRVAAGIWNRLTMSLVRHGSTCIRVTPLLPNLRHARVVRPGLAQSIIDPLTRE